MILQMHIIYYYLEPGTVEKFVEFRNVFNIKTWFQKQKFTNHQIHVIFCNMQVSSAFFSFFLFNWLQIGWNKFRQLVHCLPIRDISLIVRQRLYSSCVQSSMLHGSETWPVRKENEVALQRAEMRMVGWMCGIKLQDRISSRVERETRIRWHNLSTTAIVWHVLQKKTIIGWRNVWSMKWGVPGRKVDQRKTWKQIVET